MVKAEMYVKSAWNGTHHLGSASSVSKSQGWVWGLLVFLRLLPRPSLMAWVRQQLGSGSPAVLRLRLLMLPGDLGSSQLLKPHTWCGAALTFPRTLFELIWPPCPTNSGHLCNDISTGKKKVSWKGRKTWVNQRWGTREKNRSPRGGFNLDR